MSMIAHPRRRGVAVVLVATLLLAARAQPANAQQSISDVLSFLVTNRSIATGDFVRDEQAAAATRDTISQLLVLELGTLPITSSAGGFAYRLDPTLGTVTRSSDSFGPFFTERSLTTGRGHASLAMSYRSATFDNIDGRDLRDGTLVSTASILRGEPQPFDVETISLRIQTDTMTLSANYGVTDRLDISAAVPLYGSASEASGSTRIAGAGSSRPRARRLRRGLVTRWSARSTTCCVVERAASRSVATRDFPREAPRISLARV